jgi:hypothetical protein
MFGFGKKKQESAMDGFIKMMYGDPPPPKRANLTEAVGLARNLLTGIVDEKDLRLVGSKLSEGPIPYSTHDLALSIALNFFKNPEYVQKLKTAQLTARMTMQDWFDQKKVVPMLVESFEASLDKAYKQ